TSSAPTATYAASAHSPTGRVRTAYEAGRANRPIMIRTSGFACPTSDLMRRPPLGGVTRCPPARSGGRRVWLRRTRLRLYAQTRASRRPPPRYCGPDRRSARRAGRLRVDVRAPRRRPVDAVRHRTAGTGWHRHTGRDRTARVRRRCRLVDEVPTRY